VSTATWRSRTRRAGGPPRAMPGTGQRGW